MKEKASHLPRWRQGRASRWLRGAAAAALLLAFLLPQAAAAEPSYVVQSGDTLTQVAMTYGTTVEELALLNSLSDPDFIYIGQVLRLPDPRPAAPPAGVAEPPSEPPAEAATETGDSSCSELVHVVSAGETLGGIALRYGVSVAELAAFNGVINPSLIHVNQVLRVPGAACPQPLVLNEPFVSISWTPETPHQGDTVKLVVETRSALKGLTGTLGEARIRFISDGATHTAYVGIPALAQPGYRQAQLLIEGRPAQVLAIPVLPWEYDVERLQLTPETTRLLAPEIVQRENDLLARVSSGFTAQWYWDGTLSLPLSGDPRVTSAFGTRRAYNDGPVASYHGGADFPAEEGTPVMAGAAGVVVLAQPLDVRGNAVIVDHGGGVFTMYCHLSEILAATGDTVNPGDVVGLIGSTGLSTGPHLHWEMRVQGERVDPMRLVSGPYG
ncbi:MAG: LysM peptidoglycan-binding domain-containing M23 family metallopeptidase [Anaerolineae bacterium]|nr:LysM peptidoglycan-binding domain-containing M23 family metallopeptidase [Anaerolineae bacterium]